MVVSLFIHFPHDFTYFMFCVCSKSYTSFHRMEECSTINPRSITAQIPIGFGTNERNLLEILESEFPADNPVFPCLLDYLEVVFL